MQVLREIEFEIQELTEVASIVASYLASYEIIVFEGEMGAGKTTLVSAILQALGSSDRVSSPTYSLVNKYLLNKPLDAHTTVYHLDLFRIGSIEEVIDFGIEDILDSRQLIFIEWAEIITPMLTDYKIMHIGLKKTDTHIRKMTIFINH